MVSQPKVPDPVKTAEAQGAANMDSAIASAIVNNQNEVSPYGNVNYSRTGTESVNGKEIPRYTRTVELSPDQQTMLGQQNRLGMDLNDLAIGQVDRLGGVLDTPVDLGTTEQARTDAQEALLSRIEPQFERDRERLETTLVNRGLAPGSEAYNESMDELSRARNDARMQAVLAGSQEQGHQAQLQLSERNQPINEISALMSGGQVTVPQFSAPYQQGIQPAPIADSIYKSYGLEANNAAARNTGLFGLGSTIAGGLFAPGGLFGLSDKRLKRDIKRIGKTDGGVNIYSYKFKGHDRTHIGVMAQEMERIDPAAVAEIGGYKMVDYSRVN